jgi:hypothetical protein
MRPEGWRGSWAFSDLDYAIGDGRQLRAMNGDDRAPPGAGARDHRDQRGFGGGIKMGGRLVEQQQRGFEQRAEVA